VQSIRLRGFARVPPRSGPLATSTTNRTKHSVNHWSKKSENGAPSTNYRFSCFCFFAFWFNGAVACPLTRWNGPAWEECYDCCEADINSCCGVWSPLFVRLAFSRLAGYGIERIKYYSPRCGFACSDWVVGLILEGANSRWKSGSMFGF
jgi:hypothetical protein